MRSTTIELFACGAALALFGCSTSSGEDDSWQVPSAPSAGGGAGSQAQVMAGAPSVNGPGSGGTTGTAGMLASSAGGPGGTAGIPAMAGAGGGGTSASAGAGGKSGASGSGATAGTAGPAGAGGMAGTDDGGFAGSTQEPAPDPNGPCADLYLICFDIFDMWINPECETCNGGMGCEGCAIPFAY